MKIACIRLDKIGDLILTLPADQLLVDKGLEVTWFVAKGLGSICQRATPLRNFIEIDLNKNSPDGFHKLKAQLQSRGFEALIFFFGPGWAAKACRQSGVKIRCGRRSQWWSFFTFNLGLRQKRSLAKKHELEYNADLVWHFLNKTQDYQDTYRPTPLQLTPTASRQIFEKHGLQPGRYIVVHPGMKGSAKNWPPARYIQLIEELKSRVTILVTGTQADETWLGPITNKFEFDPNVIIAKDAFDIGQLLFALKNAKSVIVPSTGVAHLAASVGTSVIGLYPESKSQSPKRWAPLGAKVQVLSSDQPQLAGITVEQVLKLCLR